MFQDYADSSGRPEEDIAQALRVEMDTSRKPKQAHLA
jgi:hypothetical protein